MKFNKLALAALMTPLSFNVWADIKLELPKNVKLLVVNELEVSKGLSSYFTSSPDSITLKNGQNQIVYRIDQFFYKGETQSERFQSDPYILTFDAADKNIKLMVPHFSDRIEAETFSKRPKPSLIDMSSNKKHSYKFDYLGERSGFAISQDYARLIEQYNKAGGIAALTASTASTASNIEQNHNEKAINNDKGISEQLKKLFQDADVNTRKQFISWAVQNL